MPPSSEMTVPSWGTGRVSDLCAVIEGQQELAIHVLCDLAAFLAEYRSCALAPVYQAERLSPGRRQAELPADG
ncbi:hypothetical protein J2W14_000293 [Pseudarthrobacter oxydans]|nr:hypothetical protein [Pseudarthrobacter oxydans]